jgi:hypothetical protein
MKEINVHTPFLCEKTSIVQIFPALFGMVNQKSGMENVIKMIP